VGRFINYLLTPILTFIYASADYGDISILHRIFNKNSPMRQEDGLLYTGRNAEATLRNEARDDMPWPDLLRSLCSFRDTISLQFADLRWNWNSLRDKHGDGIEDYIFKWFDSRTYAWGTQWHRFDDKGNMIYRYLDDLVSE
jgi:hypothetical protein